MNINHCTYRVTWSAEDNEHVGLCTEFPSLSLGLLLPLKKRSPVYAESWAKWLPKWPPVENPFQKLLLKRTTADPNSGCVHLILISF